MTCALTLAQAGYKVTLLEKRTDLGGQGSEGGLGQGIHWSSLGDD